jgi:hypothetical protein
VTDLNVTGDAEMQQIERASDEIDRFIERQARQMEALAAAEREDRERARSYLRGQRRDYRDEWIDFYRTQIRAAESMRARAAEKQAKLIGEPVR